ARRKGAAFPAAAKPWPATPDRNGGREQRDAMAGLSKSEQTNPVASWIDSRLPIFTMMETEYRRFPTPKNFNYFWNFGALTTVALAIMIATGIFLAMDYQ